MLLHSAKFSGSIKVKQTGDQKWCGNYSLTEINVGEVRGIGKELFLMYPSKAFIRTTPDDGEWLVFHFNGYNCEGKVRVALTKSARILPPLSEA